MSPMKLIACDINYRLENIEPVFIVSTIVVLKKKTKKIWSKTVM